MKSDFCAFRRIFLVDRLFANRFESTRIDVENENLSVGAERAETRRILRRPTEILETRAKIEPHQIRSERVANRKEKKKEKFDLLRKRWSIRFFPDGSFSCQILIVPSDEQEPKMFGWNGLKRNRAEPFWRWSIDWFVSRTYRDVSNKRDKIYFSSRTYK